MSLQNDSVSAPDNWITLSSLTHWGQMTLICICQKVHLCFKKMARGLFGTRPVFWNTDGMLIKELFRYRWGLKQNKTISSEIYIWVCYVQNDVHIYQAVLESTHLFQYSFYASWLYVRRHVPYCDWWLSWQRLNALMVVSRLCYIAIGNMLCQVFIIMM